MNLLLLQEDVQVFLVENLNQKATSIALKKSSFVGINSKELAQQLVGKQKAKVKLPSWFNNLNIYYPPSLNLEQTSSEKTADYKANLISGTTLVDCTGGFGIDCVSFAKRMEKVFHCDLNEELQSIAAHNFKVLGIKNIESYTTNGIEFALKQKKINWIYIDPSRRNEAKGKVFFLEDCLPNVPLILDDLFKVTSKILIKTAPILDISVGLKSLQYVKEIHVIAVNNEVKELLWMLDIQHLEEPVIKAVNLSKNKETSVEVKLGEESYAHAILSKPKKYLYEPYASVMKAGVFNWLSQNFKVEKLHALTHLYTSEELIEFPGRCFSITAILPFNKSGMRAIVKCKTNVVTRNFKMSVAELRKKYKLQEGLDRYLFFVTDHNNKPIVIDCKKISV